MSLETITVEVPERRYDIHIGPLAELRPLLARATEGRTGRLVADTNTVNWAGPFAEIQRIVIRAGEAYKTFATVAEICSEAARAGLNRRSWLIAFGGGVTGDLTGFAAAIYMRGIDFIQIPTTLLAMIDSSVGGKTGADLPEGKNLIGCFHQPQMVLIDPALLRTLPLAERIAALAEAVKTGVMLDAELFDYISEHRQALIAPEPDTAVLTGLISFAIQGGMFLFFYGYYLCRGVVQPTWYLLLLPLLVLQMAMLGLGCGVIISALTTKYRDLVHLISFGMQLWMYGTPVAYDIKIIPAKYLSLYMLNPMTPVINAFRHAFLGLGRFDWCYYGISWLVTLFVLAVGVVLFSRVEKTFMDTI